jgi:magnesium chelatase family protein
MLFKCLSAAVYGIDAYLVEVEVDVGSGNMGDFNVVGLPDVAVKESRERIKAALKNCGFDFPAPQSVTINLAPADIRKEGSGFDLPMALGILGCEGTFFGKTLDGFVFLGELSLDGGVRPVRGTLSATLAARERGIRVLAVPEGNAREAAVVEGIDVYAVRSLPQAVDLINAPESFAPVRVDAGTLMAEASQYPVDLRDVRGQQPPSARWKSPAPAATTSSSSARRAREKRCWPSASPPSCRPCRSKKPLKPRASTAWPGCSRTRAAWWARGLSARRTTPSATPA